VFDPHGRETAQQRLAQGPAKPDLIDQPVKGAAFAVILSSHVQSLGDDRRDLVVHSQQFNLFS
jgi:hypothetical protein